MKQVTSLLPPPKSNTNRLPVDKSVYLYIRRSTPGQQKKSLMSKYQQDSWMEDMLIREGFNDIRKVDIDDGKSGQKADRDGLTTLYAAIKQHCPIAAWDVSRIWRDRTRVYYNDLIQKLKKYNVPLILSDGVFWASEEKDEKALVEKFEDAARQLDQFDKKANPARLMAIQFGKSYGGHSIPLGFYVAGTKSDRHYVVYEPHKKLVNDLYKRYRALGGNLGRLGRELVNSDFHFPPFDKSKLNGAPIPHLALPYDEGKGYRCQTRAALVSILTNRAYIGWYVFSTTLDVLDEDGNKVLDEHENPVREKVEMVVSKDGPKVIEDMELFDYAFSRLSKQNLDGSDNADKPAVERHTAKVNALLEGLITNGSIPVYAMSDGTYTAREQVNSMWKTTALVIPVARLDAMVSQVIRLLTSDFLSYCNTDIDAKLQQVQAETVERMGSLEQDLQNIEQGIKEWDMDKRSCLRTGNEEGLDKANTNLARLYKDKARTEAAIKQASSKAENVAQTGELLHTASFMWDGWSFDKRRYLTKMLVERVDIVEVSPHVLLVRVYFNDVLDYTVMDGYMFRKRGSRELWSDEENAILRRLYLSAEKSVLLEKLPVRTFASIRVQANVLDLQRQHLPVDTDMPNDLCYADYQAMQRVGMDTATRADVWQRNESAQEQANVHHNHSIPVSQQKRKRTYLDR